ncbi:MAG: IS110 family transposase [Deltaproteobacteria bacterium]|nr:IS110 family transposase [Deltaproteobacteria bacterium]
MENFAGADLHKKVTQLAVLRERKPPSQFRFSNDPHTVEEVLKRLPWGTKIAVEATGNGWWFVEKARELGHEAYLSHPKQTKAIASARLKSDKVDARMLAKLLKADLLPTVWIPGERERYIRELLSHRGRLVRARTGVINELHAVYAKRNMEVLGKAWLKAHPVPYRVKELSGYGPRIVKENVDLLRFVNEQIDGLDKELRKIAKEDPQAKRLMTLIGVGPTTAVAVSCWVGDINRFANAKKLTSYFGIAPRVRQSADRERHGHITKEGNRMVRWLLIQAALSYTRVAKGSARKHYLGVLNRQGKQIARVAAARKHLGVMYHMMKEQIDYEEFLRRGSSAQRAR